MSSIKHFNWIVELDAAVSGRSNKNDLGERNATI